MFLYTIKLFIIIRITLMDITINDIIHTTLI